MSSRGKETYSIQSVENALDMLEALCEEEEVRLSRLSERLGMSKASVFRLLATFEGLGYVEREQGSGKYRLGLSAYEIGQKFLSRMGLLRHARSVMEQLVRQCNEAAYLIVRRENDALFLHMVDNAQQVKIISLAGRRFPLQSIAAGRLFLASPALADPGARLAKAQVPLLTEEETSSIRRLGFCLDLHGAGEGIACLAVPLFKESGDVAGALALLGPDFRMQPDRMKRDLLPLLREAGEIISSRLGYLGHYLGKEHA